MCNKIQFSSAEDARDYIKVVGAKNKDGHNGRDIRKSSVYPCPECGYFHTTSATRKESRAGRKKRRQLDAVKAKASEFSSLTGITERWQWLIKNECSDFQVITGNRSYVKFKGIRQRFAID